MPDRVVKVEKELLGARGTGAHTALETIIEIFPVVLISASQMPFYWAMRGV